MIPAFTDKNAPRAPFDVGNVPRAAWYCIEVAFNHPSSNPEALADAMGCEVAREVATASTFARLQSVFEAEEQGGRGLLVTRDHSTFNPDTDTRACGWLKALHAEGGTLWAWIEWTPYGHAMVDNGEFIHFSTEYEYADFRLTADGEGAEPTRLAACTITNEPRHSGQTPCTNSRKTPQTMKKKPITRARNTGADDMTKSEDAKQPTAANTATPPADPTAANEAAKDDKPATNNEGAAKPETATNADDDPTAANGDEAAGGLTLEGAVQKVAELLGLTPDATPQDLVDAVQVQLDSIAELNEALTEAGATASNGVRGCNSKAPKFPGLTFAGKGKAALNGGTPNRPVQVRTGNVTRSINTQDKARADWCRNAVAEKEKALGRKMTQAEYSRAYNSAFRDYNAGHKR